MTPETSQLPVFVDQSGWRRRTLQAMALAVGCACLGYLLFVGTLMSGLWQPVGTQPPSTSGPVADRPEADRPPAKAHAGRENHRRPPSGRSAPPPAGGPEQ
ncbi:hypothetical protein [Streptomyces sp. NPDC048436]|uniref:hypothetical protein n=1 Tax=Streptomyces sp. NPDC048436 TaxID=3365550 RepID=UPI0037163E61